MANESKFRRLQCEQACKKLIEELGGGGGTTIITLTEEETRNLFDEGDLEYYYVGELKGLPLVLNVPTGDHRGVYVFTSIEPNALALTTTDTYLQIGDNQGMSVVDGKFMVDLMFTTSN